MSIRLDLEKELLPVDRGHCNCTDTKLLFNIQLLLRELVELSTATETPIPVDGCEYCGEKHNNQGERLNCAKKHKKKG